MNKQEFFDNLKEYSGEYDWFIINEAIRGIKKGTRNTMCPITAVIYSKLGIKKSMRTTAQAVANHLGLTLEATRDIIAGADCMYSRERPRLLSILFSETRV